MQHSEELITNCTGVYIAYKQPNPVFPFRMQFDTVELTTLAANFLVLSPHKIVNCFLSETIMATFFPELVLTNVILRPSLLSNSSGSMEI